MAYSDEVLRYDSYGWKYEVPRKLVSSLNDLERGDHIAFHRIAGCYWHHAIVEDVNKRSSEFCLIEYSNTASGFLEDNLCLPKNPGIAKVVRQTYRFSEVTMVYLMLHECCNPADTVVENARSRIGESKYNPFTNNCEHFAMWCKTGTSSSDQVNKAAQMVTDEISFEVASTGTRETAKYVGRTVLKVVTRAANEIPIAYNHVTEGIVGAATNLQKAGGELFAKMPPLPLPTGGGTAANLPTTRIGSRIVGAATKLQKAGGVLFVKMPPLRLPTGGGLPPLLSTGAGTAAKFISRGGQAIMRTGIGGVLAAGALPAIVEGMSVNSDLNNLRRDLDEKRIDEKEYHKTVKKRLVTGASNVTGATTGTLIGQALIPVPVVGAVIGGAVGGIAGLYLGNIGGNLAFDKNGGDGANYAEKRKVDSEEDLGGGGQYYSDDGADYVEESDEDNEDVLGGGGQYYSNGGADYVEESDEDNEDVLGGGGQYYSNGGADYVEESDEDNEDVLGGGGQYYSNGGADYVEESDKDNGVVLGGGGQYYSDDGADYVEESDEDNGVVLGGGGQYYSYGGADCVEESDGDNGIVLGRGGQYYSDDGADYVEESDKDNGIVLGGGGQYYSDDGADYVEESYKDNGVVLGGGDYNSLCGRADYADNDDVEDEEDNLEVITFYSDGGVDYDEESDEFEDSEEGLGGGGYYSHFSRADYDDSTYVLDNEEELLFNTDSADESDRDSEEDLGKSAVHASSCAKKSGCTKRLTHRLRTVSLNNYAVMLIMLIMLLTVFTRVVS